MIRRGPALSGRQGFETANTRRSRVHIPLSKTHNGSTVWPPEVDTARFLAFTPFVMITLRPLLVSRLSREPLGLSPGGLGSATPSRGNSFHGCAPLHRSLQLLGNPRIEAFACQCRRDNQLTMQIRRNPGDELAGKRFDRRLTTRSAELQRVIARLVKRQLHLGDKTKCPWKVIPSRALTTSPWMIPTSASNSTAPKPPLSSIMVSAPPLSAAADGTGRLPGVSTAGDRLCLPAVLAAPH